MMFLLGYLLIGFLSNIYVHNSFNKLNKTKESFRFNFELIGMICFWPLMLAFSLPAIENLKSIRKKHLSQILKNNFISLYKY